MKYDFRTNQFTETDVDPSKLAIAGTDEDYTWETLRNKVEEIGETIKSLNIPPNNPIIIFGHKESLYAAVILACYNLKQTYIPTDIIYPKERIARIAAITGAQIVFNCSNSPIDIPFAIEINNKLQINTHSSPKFSKRIIDGGDVLQYIMFTSGSTGEPKGVQILNSSVVKYIDWATTHFGYTKHDVFMNQAPFTFDVSLTDFTSSMALGATLVLNAAEVTKDQEKFLERLNNYKCTVWTSTPSFAFLYLRNPKFNFEGLPHLNSFLFIGEQLPSRTSGSLKANFPKSRILNAYGPTETTMVMSVIEITSEIINKYPSLPIGYTNTELETLIEKTDPESKEGEFIIAGETVSIGYFNREDLNSKAFFIHNGKRAYRTGDLVYYEDGMLFFIGRNDDQVKINGYRIELGEISNELCKNSNVIEAVSIALKRNNEVKKIVSFVKLKSGSASVSASELLDHAAKALPQYMIPGDISIVKEFPYNTNHKVDKNKLIEEYIKLATLS